MNRSAGPSKMTSSSAPADASPRTFLLGNKRKRENGSKSQQAQNPADFVSLEMEGDSSSPDSLVFLKPTEEMVAAYKMEVVSALRTEKVEELRKLHEAGQQLQCCNRFGESLLHMACRRGMTEIVRFLVRDAKVSLLVKDDYGRTPLHDAFWTPKPKFDLVQFIVEQVPELLCVRDVRGHLPLHYVRKEDWELWCDFFAGRKNLLRPKQGGCAPQECE